MQYAIIPVTPWRQNCTLMWCEATMQGVVSDPGDEIERILDTAQAFGVRIEKAILTHGHPDHAYAAGELAQRLGVPIEGPHRAEGVVLDQLATLAARIGMAARPAFVPDRWLAHGDPVSFGREQLDVTHCPGHTPGHVVYFHRGSKLAIVGDVLFAGSIGRWDTAGGSYNTLVRSIRERLWPLGYDVTFVPGHGRNSTFGRERAYNQFVADATFSDPFML